MSTKNYTHRNKSVKIAEKVTKNQLKLGLQKKTFKLADFLTKYL